MRPEKVFGHAFHGVSCQGFAFAGPVRQRTQELETIIRARELNITCQPMLWITGYWVLLGNRIAPVEHPTFTARLKLEYFVVPYANHSLETGTIGAVTRALAGAPLLPLSELEQIATLTICAANHRSGRI